MSEDFGSYLKHERELRGVPLDDIAESTKISIRFLRALEEGRFEDLPGEVFIKGFIRSYGQAIGSNVDELLAAYHESSSKGQDTGSTDTGIPPKEEPPERPFVFPTKAVLGFVAALLIIGGGGYWITAKKGENTGTSQQTQVASPSTVDNSLPEIEVESPAPEEEIVPLSETEPDRSDAAGSSDSPIQEKPQEAPAEVAGAQEPVKNTFTVPEKIDIIKDIQDQTVPESTEPSTEAALGESPLNLVIKVDENSWFNLRVDDQRDQDFILPPGGSKTIQAKIAVVMTIGNRRATQLTLNGQPLDLPESPDNVIRNLTVNAEQLN
jgi:cytoskeleton protein RodZ